MTKKLMYELEIMGEIIIADSFIKRLLGYMFRKKPHHEMLMIMPCSSIHTFFMKFDIDVIFINKDMEVIKKIEGLRPSKVIMPVKKTVAVIEAEAGKFKNVKEGGKIKLCF